MCYHAEKPNCSILMANVAIICNAIKLSLRLHPPPHSQKSKTKKKYQKLTPLHDNIQHSYSHILKALFSFVIFQNVILGTSRKRYARYVSQ